MSFLIDGHNLLWFVNKAASDVPPIGEVRLCMIISRYLKITGANGLLVFDGTGPSDKSAFANLGSLEVLFAGRDSDADSVIEERISASSSPSSLKVVSSDNMVLNAAHRRKAAEMKCDVFWESLCRELARRRRPREPLQKRFGLTEAETEYWLKVFGLKS
jgi:predicted RNA-binding protein with PIN domain